mmetsp:Transcript_8144/g.21564  ORF Transcript_8144/g.21564 Transcript_8144/m.21564 type:complete len:204 (-) Transcript_8144:710-1321(-)
MKLSCAFSTATTGFSTPTIQCMKHPSESPDTSSDSWMGCHVAEEISPSCPLNTHTSFIIRISNTFTILSRAAERKKLPFWFHSSLDIIFLCKCFVVKQPSVRGSQNLTALSFPPLITSPFVGCHAADLTSPPCPFKHLSSSDRLKSHTFTSPSSEPVMNLWSPGPKLTVRTGIDGCASKALILFMLGSQYFTFPLVSADMRCF